MTANFRSIKAYSLKLKSKNGQYHEGVTFEHIVSLYHFDSELRQLLFLKYPKADVGTMGFPENWKSVLTD